MATEDQFNPSRKQVDDLVAYLDALTGPADTLFTWRGGDRGPDGVIAMPWVEYSKPVMSFVQDAYRLGFVIDFNWPDWQETAVGLQQSPAAMRKANLVDLAKLLTVHLRKDRFVTGHLASALRNGWIQDILWSMREIAENSDEGRP
jgi:hypothetical protein